FCSSLIRRRHIPPSFPYTTLFRSHVRFPHFAPTGRLPVWVGGSAPRTRTRTTRHQRPACCQLHQGGTAPHGPPRADSRCHRELVDRKSTRLNSSHVSISYAVFCLK